MTSPDIPEVDTVADGSFPEPVEPDVPEEDKDKDPDQLVGEYLTDEEVLRALPEDTEEV